MRRVTVEQLAADPVGCYVAGETHLHFCAAPSLWGIIMWGRPDEAQAIALGRSLIKQLAPPAVPHVSIFDVSRVEAIDPGAFAAAGRYLTNNHGALHQYLLRLALIRPAGIGGAIVAGAFDVLPRPYPARVFADPRDAYAWLRAEDGRPDWPEDGAQLLVDLHRVASGTPALIGQLRAILERDLADARVQVAAKQLGLSARSLQRKLAELGTSFQDQLADARIGAAKRLLIDGDTPLTSVALDVGFASLQAFSARFRERERETPTAFRKRHRGG